MKKNQRVQILSTAIIIFSQIKVCEKKPGGALNPGGALIIQEVLSIQVVVHRLLAPRCSLHLVKLAVLDDVMDALRHRLDEPRVHFVQVLQ